MGFNWQSLKSFEIEKAQLNFRPSFAQQMGCDIWFVFLFILFLFFIYSI